MKNGRLSELSHHGWIPLSVIRQNFIIKVKKKFDAFAKSFPQLGFYVKTKSCEILLLHFKNGKKLESNVKKMPK